MARTDSSHDPASSDSDSTSIEGADSLILFRRAKGGDARACEAFFRRYSPRVHDIAHRRMGARVRSYAESADVAQDAMIEAVEDLGELRVEGRSHLRRLFARLVQHRISALCRHHRADRRDRDREQPMEGNPDDPRGRDGMEPAAKGPGPLEELERSEGLGLLQRCIAELSPDHRAVVRLRLVQRLSWERVAQELGRSTPDSARMLHRRAMLELRRVLRRHSRDDDS